MTTFYPQKIIGHRGAAGIAPENTLSAIQAALDLGVDYIEIDVRLTKDGIPVVLHDRSIRRTTKKWSSIHQLSLKDLTTLDAGIWFNEKFAGEKIPTLEEVLTLINGKTGLMLEIKPCYQSPHLVVNAIFNVLCNQARLPSKLAIGSFSYETVREVQKHAHSFKQPLQTIGIIEKHGMIAKFESLNVNLMALWHKIITPEPEIVQRLHKSNIEIWSFTVDNLALAQFLLSAGVSGIISNHPEILVAARHGTE